MQELKLYKNTWTRKDMPIDRQMVKECLKNYNEFTYTKNSVVMDLGANIGGFVQMLKSTPIKSYIGVEPDPANIEIAKLNGKDAPFEVIWIEGAATNREVEYLTFYNSGSNNSASSGTATPSNISNYTKKGSSWTVKNYNLNDLFETYKPTHLKIDIEGSELEWLEAQNAFIPDCVEQVAIELHRKEGIVKFDRYWYDILKKDFEVNYNILHGYKSSGCIEKFPNLGITIEGRVFGVDVFLKRK